MQIKYGQPIPQSISDAIRFNIKVSNFGEYAAQSGISLASLKNIVYGNQAITKDKHAKAIMYMVKMANREARKTLIIKKKEIDFLNSINYEQAPETI